MVTTDDGGSATAIRDALKRIRDVTAIFETDQDEYRKGLVGVVSALQGMVGQFGEIELNVSTNRVMHGDDEVYKSEARSNNLAFDMFSQGLRRIIFRPGLVADEVTAFMDRFSECRNADQIDEDFVTLMWQESTENIKVLAIDNYTEKIFMSEEDFVASFRTVLEDVAPGLLEMNDDDEDDEDPRELVQLDDEQAADLADLEQRKVRKSFESGIDERMRACLMTPQDIAASTDHLVHLFVVQLMTENSPLSDAELQGIVVEILNAYLQARLWQNFADAVRTLNQVFALRDRLAPSLSERVEKVRKVVIGRDMAEHIAQSLDPEETNFTAWARWLYTTEDGLSAPALLELINTSTHDPGTDWLKDLLRRQSTASLDPWAERLRDPNPRIVIEVIDVITSSELGTQAKPLLLEAVRHDNAEVRACALKALDGTYDQLVRQEMLPLLKDPDTGVRRLVVASFLKARDRSVSPYLANIIKSGEVGAFDEDEQREVFEALALLGGDAFFTLFRDQLDLDEGKLGRFLKKKETAVQDSLTRRAAVSALSRLNSSQGTALINEVKRRADLALAAHCDVVLRLANRDQGLDIGDESVVESVPTSTAEDIAAGRHRMGERVLFSLPDIGINRYLTSQPKIENASKSEDSESSALGEVVSDTVSAPLRVEAPTDAPDLGLNPLLNHTDVLSVSDRIRLSANPMTVKGERFQLQDISLVLSGASKNEAEAKVRTADFVTRPPARIIERSKAPMDSRDQFRPSSIPPASSDFVPAKASQLPADPLNLEDLLKEYVEAPGSPSEPQQPSFDAGDNLENILSAYLGQEEPVSGESALSTKKAQSKEAIDDVLKSFLDADSDGEQ